MDKNKTSILLELSACDDVIGFKTTVDKENLDINESCSWYCRRINSKKMGFEERTPLMIASMFGSKQILSYILQSDRIDVNKASKSDGATALHCAISGGSSSSFEIVKLLLDSSADINAADLTGIRPVDLITPNLNSKNGKKEYPIDLSFPDIKNDIYSTDEFRMYMFKIKPCSRAYSHDWTECPFVHPGENARRRDPIKYNYTNVPCPEFRKGICRNGDSCEFAHGIFESWLHPAQYRTRLCKDETGCARKVCFFAHKTDELRPVFASTGSAVQISSTQMTILPPVVNHHFLDDVMYPGSPRLGLSPNMNRLSLRSTAFATRSQSFVDRGVVDQHLGFSSPTLQGWGSPDGKLDWGIRKEDLNKLRKSASFGVRSNISTPQEPNPFWVQPPVHDGSPEKTRFSNFDEEQRFSTWAAEQLYMEQEQMVV
jgi:hypothetical protein